MKFKLNAKDRLIIPNILPPEGTMIEQTIVKEIIDMIKLGSGELAKYGIIENVVTGSLDGLDPKKNPKILEETEYDFSKLYTDSLKDAVEKKDNDKKINQSIIETCEKIKKMW